MLRSVNAGAAVQIPCVSNTMRFIEGVGSGSAESGHGSGQCCLSHQVARQCHRKSAVPVSANKCRAHPLVNCPPAAVKLGAQPLVSLCWLDGSEHVV